MLTQPSQIAPHLDRTLQKLDLLRTQHRQGSADSAVLIMTLQIKTLALSTPNHPRLHCVSDDRWLWILLKVQISSAWFAYSLLKNAAWPTGPGEGGREGGRERKTPAQSCSTHSWMEKEATFNSQLGNLWEISETRYNATHANGMAVTVELPSN